MGFILLANWLLAILPGALRLLIARAGGIAIEDVSLGIGSILWQRGAFRVRAFPVGLVVRVAEPRWPLRVLILSSGMISYYIFSAALIAFCLLAYGRLVESPAPMIGGLAAGKPAEAAGLQEGDVILAIDGHPVGAMNQVAPAIDASEGRPIEFVVRRDGERRTHTVTPIRDGSGYRAGIEMWPTSERLPVSIGEAIAEAAQFPLIQARVLASRASGADNREFSGPIGIVKIARRIRPTFEPTLRLLAILSAALLMVAAAIDGARLLRWLLRRR